MRERESAWETISRRIFCVEEKNYSLSREQQIEEEEEDGKEKEKSLFQNSVLSRSRGTRNRFEKAASVVD